MCEIGNAHKAIDSSAQVFFVDSDGKVICEETVTFKMSHGRAETLIVMFEYLLDKGSIA